MNDFKKLGVIGHPISHSKSPIIHQYWIEKHGLQGSYEILDIPPKDLPRALPELIDQGYSGFNLTVPHKQLALGICDEIDDIARGVGAVNTITVANNKMIGTNTDVFGFIENIAQCQPGFDFTGGPAIILGAGGAARAAVYGLLARGASEIIVLNRTREKAENLASMNNDKVKVMDWSARNDALHSATLLVNTTTLGMSGQLDLDIDLDALPTTALVNDIVYAPLQPPLCNVAACT